MQYTRAAALVAAAAMAGGLTGCGEAEEPGGPTSTATPYTPAGQGGDSSSSGSGSSSGSSTSASSAGSSSTSSSAPGPGNGDSSSKMPAVARERTKDGAAAFGKYYYKQGGEAAKTGNVDRLKPLSLASCPPCNELVKSIEDDYKKGRVRGVNPYTLSNVKATKRPDRGYKVTMHVDVAAHKALEDGEAYGKVDATSYQLTEQVVWQNGAWKIADWSIS